VIEIDGEDGYDGYFTEKVTIKETTEMMGIHSNQRINMNNANNGRYFTSIR
jgi:hypothetical protein